MTQLVSQQNRQQRAAIGETAAEHIRMSEEKSPLLDAHLGEHEKDSRHKRCPDRQEQQKQMKHKPPRSHFRKSDRGFRTAEGKISRGSC
jgi:hypothetical protein